MISVLFLTGSAEGDRQFGLTAFALFVILVLVVAYGSDLVRWICRRVRR